MNIKRAFLIAATALMLIPGYAMAQSFGPVRRFCNVSAESSGRGLIPRLTLF